jgi:L-lactate dehydrogenase complex protein LldF
VSTQHPVHIVPSVEFKARAKEALADDKLRKNFRGAMDFLRSKRLAQFPNDDELQQLRTLGESIRKHALRNLPRLLEKLESQLTANGVQVHWAENAEEANAIIHRIAARRGAKSVIKGKSMASEEIELNDYLGERGIHCVESDMGEYVVQLAHEKPSHIVMPAIHKTKGDIAELFHEEIPDTPYTEDVDELIQIGRKTLRQMFVNADVGLSGVNFAIAETGTLWLVENEGNGRLSTTIPDTHIAIMGIEKVVEKLEHVIPLASLLTRSATGQAITTYFNLISSPRRPGELDGPREVHLVLLDNGRTQAFEDEELRATLQCIRCGACMNHCPVYARLGGHAYGTTPTAPSIPAPSARSSLPTCWAWKTPGTCPPPPASAAPAPKSARCAFPFRRC